MSDTKDLKDAGGVIPASIGTRILLSDLAGYISTVKDDWEKEEEYAEPSETFPMINASVFEGILLTALVAAEERAAEGFEDQRRECEEEDWDQHDQFNHEAFFVIGEFIDSIYESLRQITVQVSRPTAKG